MAVTHAKVSAKADPPDTTLIRPTDWNATHTVDWAETGDIVQQVFGDAPNAGALNEFARGDHRHGMPPTAGELGFYNVMDYGALGNGVANDQPAIQAAIDAANTVTIGTFGGTVFFPPGFFRILAPIESYNTIHILGSGVDATIINNETSGDTFQFFGSVPLDGGPPPYVHEFWSSIQKMTIDRNASATPNKAISINTAAFIQVRDVKIMHHAYGVWGDYMEQCTFENVDFRGSSVANLYITGADGSHSSNANRFIRCLFMGGPIGAYLNAHVASNIFEDTPFYSLAAGAVYTPTGAAAVTGNTFIRGWQEVDAPFDIRGGTAWQFIDTVMSNETMPMFTSTTVLDPTSRIVNSLDYRASAQTAPVQNVEFAENGMGALYSGQVLGTNRSFVYDSSHMANLSARGLAAYSFAAAGLGQGAKEKNLSAWPNLTDWTLLSGTAVAGGQADPLGGTGAHRLATNTVVELNTGSANGGAALTGATFTIQLLAKSAGGRLFMEMSDNVNSEVTGSRLVALPVDGWHVISWTYTFPAGSTGTSLRFQLHGTASAQPIDIYWPIKSLGRSIIPWLPAGCDMSGWNGPYEVFGPNHNIRVYGTAAPGSLTWRVGDQLVNTTPTAGGTYAWICTTAGTPGTWKAIALAA